MKCLVLIELDLTIAKAWLPELLGRPLCTFKRLIFTIFQSLIGFYLLVCCGFFLLEGTGYFINHHFKVACVICIQMLKAACSTQVHVVSNPMNKELQQPRASGGWLKQEKLQCPQEHLILGLSFPSLLHAPQWELQDTGPGKNAITQRHLLLIFRSIRAPIWWNTVSLLFALEVTTEERLFILHLYYLYSYGDRTAFLLAACPHRNRLSQSKGSPKQECCSVGRSFCWKQ